MIYFQGKKVKEIYFRGKKVKELWFNGKKYFSGVKQIVIEYERTSTETAKSRIDIYGNPTNDELKKTLTFPDVVATTANKIVNVTRQYTKRPTLPSGSSGSVYLKGAFKISDSSLSMVKARKIEVIEPWFSVESRNSIGKDAVKPLYAVRITISYK